MIRQVASLSLLAALFCVSVEAQELRGSIRGSVTDATGSIVVGASVTLRNVNTGIQTARLTSETGSYLFDFVSPGSYTLTVEMQGFRAFVQEKHPCPDPL